MLLVLEYLKNQIFYTYWDAIVRVAKPRPGTGLYVAMYNVQRCISMHVGVQPEENLNFCDCHHLHKTAVVNKVSASMGLTLCAETSIHKSPKFYLKTNFIKSYYQYEIKEHIFFFFIFFFLLSFQESK